MEQEQIEQNEPVVNVVFEGEDQKTPETNEEPSKSEPTEQEPVENQPEQKPKDETTINQEAVNRAINKQHAKFKAAEEERLRLQAELDAIRGKVESIQPVPDMPDPFDDDYQAKLKARDAILQANARKMYEADMAKRAEEEKQREYVAARHRELNEATIKYQDAAKQGGIDQANLSLYEMVFAAANPSPDLADFILKHKSGPFIIEHLGKNLEELDKIVGMSPTHAAAYIAESVAPKLGAKVKTKYATTGDLQGSGSPRNEDPILKGVKFE